MNRSATTNWIDLPVEWHEYHDGLIGLRRQKPDGSYYLIVLDASSSVMFKLMLDRTFKCVGAVNWSGSAVQLGRLPVGQRLQPNAQGHAGTLGRGLVPLPLPRRNPDVYTHAGRVFQGGSTPLSFGCGHGDILDSQIILDKPPVRVFNVLTLNKETDMSAKDLIEMANKNGYSVGRNHSKSYRYGATENGKHVEREFVGTWGEFCKMMKGLCK